MQTHLQWPLGIHPFPWGAVIIHKIFLLHPQYNYVKIELRLKTSSVRLCFLNELSEFDVSFVVQVEGNHNPNHVQEDKDKPEILELEVRVKPWWPILCVCVCVGRVSGGGWGHC